MDLHVDLGQLLIVAVTAVMAIMGYLIKKEITSFGRRLDKHDDILFRFSGQIQRLIGYYAGKFDQKSVMNGDDTPSFS